VAAAKDVLAGAAAAESAAAAEESQAAPPQASKSEQARIYQTVVEALKEFSKVSGQPGQTDLNVAGELEITQLLEEQDQERAADVAHAITTFRRKHKGLLLSHDQLAHIAGMTPALLKFLEDRSYLGDFTIRRVEYVGPKVGEELAEKAFLAMILALTGMLIYITVRFRKLGFALGAILALVHDGIISAGVFNLGGGQFDLTIVAGILTLLGYSINDTIVIFDRVREDMRSMRGRELSGVFNLAINQTLSRTLLTSLTTLLVVVCLFQFGGATLHGFSFVLLFGIIAGTYSTIFIASPVVIGYLTWMERRQAKTRKASVRAGRRRAAGKR
ncbi:MAG: protein translocase subunit SecF, partial [Acidobacteriota bacterium]